MKGIKANLRTNPKSVEINLGVALPSDHVVTPNVAVE
jgi:hypothetical protein